MLDVSGEKKGGVRSSTVRQYKPINPKRYSQKDLRACLKLVVINLKINQQGLGTEQRELDWDGIY